MNFVITIFCVISLAGAELTSVNDRRTKLIEDELKLSVGGKLELSAEEKILNRLLMKWKIEELDGLNASSPNIWGSYFDYKDEIPKSKVYQFIKAMPKGALLHIHSNAILDADYFVNITYWDHLYACFQNELIFLFSDKVPEVACQTKWQLVSNLRRRLSNVTKFDMELRNNFTMVESDPKMYAIDRWTRMNNIFRLVFPLLIYRPVFEDYLYDSLKYIRSDKVTYVELRMSVPELYELDGTKHEQSYFVNVTEKVLRRFKRDFPDFIGVKIICSFGKTFKETPEDVANYLMLTRKLKQDFPDLIVGFDLVGHEDSSRPLVYFMDKFISAQDLNYYFHAGETKLYGAPSDENLVDAIVLKSKRLGHALALAKHPMLLQEVNRNDICVEVCVVSNNVLGYISDIRDHPVTNYISQGLKVVLSGDDSGFWESDVVSTDFYVTFMGAASRKHDIKLLKQLALNSIECSALTDSERDTAMKMFNDEWNRFVNSYVRLNGAT